MQIATPITRMAIHRTPHFAMGHSRQTAVQLFIAACLLAMIALFAPLVARGQCQPAAGSVKSQPSASPSSAPGQPQFFDQPQFTVAGVTDATNPGGHGSDTVLRTKEALAKETAALGKESPSPSPAARAAAEQSLRDAAHAPGNFEANYQLGKLLFAEGKAGEALPYLGRASRLNRSDNNSPDQAAVHHLLGDVEEKLGNPLEAVRQYQRAAELDPSEPNLFDWGAELLLHRAVEPAVDVFTKGNRLFPGSTRMLLGLGVAWYDRGSYDQAARRLCEASDLKPDDPTPYLFLGKIQSVEINQPQGISERLERFARLHPENALANYYYAVSLWKQRKGPEDTTNMPQVESLLNQAIHLDPKLGVAHLQLGILYSEQKDLHQAISAYQQAIDVSPRLEEAHYRLAQAYRQTGQTQKAKDELQLYQRLSKENAGETESQRREIKEFVYTTRGQAPGPPPR